MSEYWRVVIGNRVFKLFSVGGLSCSDMAMLYPGSKASMITSEEFLQ